MKTLLLGSRAVSNCEGVSRRDALKVGALSLFGLTLPQLLALRGASAAPAKAESVILIWLQGGPSHLDTFDPKPEAASEVRGQFSAIPTAVDGIQLSEHLPNTAKVMNQVALVRSLTSGIAAHEDATRYMLTGYRPLPSLKYPAYGAVVAKEMGGRSSLPPYVTVPDPGRAGESGFIGASYSPFVVGDPSAAGFEVKNLNLPYGVDEARLQRRLQHTKLLDGRFGSGLPDDSVRSTDSFYEKAYDLVHSAPARKAFDLGQEPQSLRERYGSTTLGQGCLLARRLVEAGARFITVTKQGWDTHQNNFPTLQNRLLPELDRAYASLIADMAQRGSLDRTLVILMGEFGRTPRVNPRGGRDHWSRCRFVAFAGAGIRGGQAIGRSDSDGAMPAERPVTVEDVATTLYTALGIDPSKQYHTPTGRPIHLAANGAAIGELWG
jgi:hypothetical protein